MRLKLEVTLKLEMTSKVATELRLNLKLQTEMTREMFKTGRDQGAEEDGARKKKHGRNIEKQAGCAYVLQLRPSFQLPFVLLARQQTQHRWLTKWRILRHALFEVHPFPTYPPAPPFYSRCHHAAIFVRQSGRAQG